MYHTQDDKVVTGVTGAQHCTEVGPQVTGSFLHSQSVPPICARENSIAGRERAPTRRTGLLVELKLRVGLLDVALVALLDVSRQDYIPVPTHSLHSTASSCHRSQRNLSLTARVTARVAVYRQLCMAEQMRVQQSTGRRFHAGLQPLVRCAMCCMLKDDERHRCTAREGAGGGGRACMPASWQMEEISAAEILSVRPM